MKKTYYILLYGGDTCHNGTVCGPETRKRCERLVRFIKGNPYLRYVIILSASGSAQPGQPPLNKVMRAYLIKIFQSEFAGYKNLIAPEIICTTDSAWNTANESISAAHWFEQEQTSEFYVLSSWYHLPRICMIWNIYNGGFTIHYIPAASYDKEWAFKSTVRELFAIPKVLLCDSSSLLKKRLPIPA